MKLLNSITLILLFAFASSSNLFAVVTPATDNTESAISTDKMIDKMFPPGTDLTNKQMKRKAKMEKVLSKIDNKLNKINAKRAAKGKAGVDFNDPVKKWMWFWIFGWGAGIVLSILAGVLFTGSATSGNLSGIGGAGIVWLLASLCYLFGSVSLIIWIVKNFA